MTKIAVIYQSNYGATRKYAQWLAQELGADLLARKTVDGQLLAIYDCVIFGGGLYASGIIGSDLVAKNACQNLLVFTVGLAAPKETDYSAILKRAFPNPAYQPKKVFHLRGAIDYQQLSFIHRNLMKLLKKTIEKKPKSELSSENKAILETYGQTIDFTEKSAILPIVAAAREIVAD